MTKHLHLSHVHWLKVSCVRCIGSLNGNIGNLHICCCQSHESPLDASECHLIPFLSPPYHLKCLQEILSREIILSKTDGAASFPTRMQPNQGLCQKPFPETAAFMLYSMWTIWWN